jgi:hypothetical protein
MQCFEDIDTKNPTLKALDLILAAWDEGVDTGVEPQQMAYAALFTALTDLVAIYGEDAVIHLTRGLEKRVVEGEFTLARTPGEAGSARRAVRNCRPSRSPQR